VTTDRRRFLRDAFCLGAGAAAASWFSSGRSASYDVLAADGAASAEQRVKELKLDLPVPASANKVIVPAVRVGNVLYVSGHGPRSADGSRVVGKVGKDMDTKQAAEAARSVALTILGVVRAELGSLDSVKRVVKVLGMVNCTADFVESPQVINGFSQVLIDVFGEQAGRGARSAVGMVSLPGGIPVEVEAIFEVRA
jgi:enamine deaminase RidA (YjgF/YER057c/UK114 family)